MRARARVHDRVYRTSIRIMVYRCNAFFKCVDTRFEHASRVWKQWERTNKEKKRGIEKIKRDANRGKKLDTYGIIFERDAFATRLFRANLIDSNVYLHIVRTVGRIEFASFDRVFDSK